MAETYYSFLPPSHPQPYSSPGDEVKDANEDEQFRETEFFEDTQVIHNSPFTENLNLNTELVEGSDLEEKMTSGSICEYEQEIVLDSEDEEMDNREAVTVYKGLLEDKISPTLKSPLMRFQKRQPKNSPCEQAASNASACGKSPTGLDHIHSADHGDSTEAALGFVDRYLSSNNMDLFQGIQQRKATRVKSPHVPSARGSLSLAKKIKARTHKEENEPFKLDDSDQNDKGAGTFCKNIEATSNFGRYGETYKRRQKKGGHLQHQGNCSTGNRCEEKLVQGPGMVTDKNNSMKELYVQSSATRDNVDPFSSVTHTEDMSDIGFDTQIAAEAMEALAYVPPDGIYFNDAHQPENALNGSISYLTENESHLKSSSNSQNPGLQSISIKSKKRNVSLCSFSTVTSSSSYKHTENQDPNPISGRMKRITEIKSNIEEQLKNNSSSPICGKHISFEQGCSLGWNQSFQHAAKEHKNWNDESRPSRIKDQPNHHTGGDNSIKEEGIIRYKRKENGLVDDLLKLDVGSKYLKLPTNSGGVTGKSRLNHQVQVNPQLTASSSVSWLYPKRPRGKRKRANVHINLDAPTILCIDGKENIYSTRCLEGQDDVGESCFPHTHTLCKTSSIDNGKCLLQGDSVHPGSAGKAMKFENMHDLHPFLLAHVETSLNKSVAKPSSENQAPITLSEGIKISNANNTYNDNNKKPCSKNLPKSPLLKELNRLGLSDSRQDLTWKDLRQRRDMTYIRVLFSQHLDDSVIKQQKKIMARLNISLASNSMEATHFVADKFTRTKNMLETMALGKLVVTHLWLESCGQAYCFIDEKNYILRDFKKEKEIGFNMAVSLSRARQKPLLKGKRVYITPHIKPDKEVVTSLVTTAHGQVVDETRICLDKNDKICDTDDLLILSCEDDSEICYHFLNRGIAVYSSELLLNGIVIQKLEFERHQLFKNQVTRNDPVMSNRFGKVCKRRLRPISGP